MRKAVILAAGRGTRMGSLTEDLPKPMLPLAGRPIVEHVMERLRGAGFAEFALVVGYRREAMEQYFSGSRAGRGITFLVQEKPDGTGSAARLAREFVAGEDFLLTFGDILSESEDYAAMAEKLASDCHALAVAAVRWVDDPWQGAAVYEDAGVVTRIIEKPAPGTSATNWNSAGIYCFRSSVFDELARLPLSPRGEYELTTAVASLVARGHVLIHPLRGVWRDIGRPEDLALAQREV